MMRLLVWLGSSFYAHREKTMYTVKIDKYAQFRTIIKAGAAKKKMAGACSVYR